MAVARKTNEGFWDRIAAKYARQPIADQAAYEHKLEVTQQYLTADTKLFEFGCGTGSTAIIHATKVAHIVAIDVSENMLAIAREKALDANIDNIEFIRSRIEEYDAQPGSFDVVLGMSIIHLLPDRQAALTKIHSLLAPNGAFISSTACLKDSTGFLRPFLWIGRQIGKLPYVSFFSKDEFLDELRDAGFVIEYEWQPGKSKGLFVVARKPS
ncbi:class I SAM-dependent methyltransferase [Hyphococcus sp. DH-69]|uniref:class I SAM-dependent methyltransferase n=1 Tax=Hyphococcus formosus TaxID=3143534 RepID=UPI00398B30E9